MSVLKSKRNNSKTQFVSTAREIFIEVEKFRTKLSERYSRTYGNDIYRYARNVMLLCESASSIWVKDELTYNIRRTYLLRAIAGLRSLDVMMYFVYEVINENPQGCFRTSNSKKLISSAEAVRRIDNMSIKLGTLIDLEIGLLKSVLEYTDNRIKDIREGKDTTVESKPFNSKNTQSKFRKSKNVVSKSSAIENDSLPNYSDIVKSDNADLAMDSDNPF